ncbi:MAG: tRNA (guanosine(37)-N1)-methyltransferase TrmD, partial [Parcubacteria group bacterium]|nr:tRNA (guanosine(37)-N1)-methyltransferase TrmD [Parcubacteria group bacterium]
MIRFDIITIFPKAFRSYLGVSILKRAQRNKHIHVSLHDLRQWSRDRHRTVDDTPYGGGAGMVLMASPIIDAVESIRTRSKEKIKVILLSAKGEEFHQKMAYDLARRYDRVILISGRYEGVDERVKKVLRAHEVSIGRYVLTDGDIAAMVIISAVARLVPGVISFGSLKEESHWNLLLKNEKTGYEYPHYTRPETIEHNGKKYRVPRVLLSGDHA